MKLAFKGFVIGIGGVLVVLGLGLVLGASQWDTWARKGLERQLSRILEVPVTVGRVVTHPMARAFEITDLAVSNPQAFDVGPAVELPRVLMTVDPKTMLGREIVIPTICAERARIHLRYLPGKGTNIRVLTDRARAWRDGTHWGWRAPSYRVDLLTCTDAELTTYALGRTTTVPLADIALRDLRSEESASMGTMAAAMFQRALEEMVSAETVMEGLGERLGEELRKWMGESPI